MSQLALLGGPKTKGKPFPSWPQYDETERRALNEVLQSRLWWRTEGTKALEFERAFASYHGAKHCVAVTNGTAAIEVVMAALNISPGDEVIVPDSTFVATASAVLFAGAMPVMVDVLPETDCIDPALAEAAITPRTKAIIAVHLGGHPADLERLAEISARRGIPLIEDCAHAHSSEWRGRRVGTFGVAGTFSFQASKLMTAGEGGVIITNDDEVERLARSVHDCGRMPGQWFYSHYIYGSNYRLSEWQGAVLNAQLGRLDEQTARRHRNALLLDELLAEIDGVTPQTLDPRCTRDGHYAYIFHFEPKVFAGVPVEKLMKALEAEGIPCEPGYPPVHSLDLFTSGAYRQRLAGEQRAREHSFLKQPYPNAQRAFSEAIWIPQPALLGDEEDMSEIAAGVRKVQTYAAELA
jgi:dTDP-4-amino-4,6-dideoxygalactose transaminase